jgi:hypothetical protein
MGKQPRLPPGDTNEPMCSPSEAFMRALQRQPDDIKVVVQFSEA